jgi:serine/threonine protein kinase
VLDFGISKMSGVGAPDGAGAMTHSAALLGSPAYMSPEQMTSARTVDARSDIWALGIILFEFLTGQLPFNGGSIPEICMEITGRPAPFVRSIRPEIPAELEAVVARCLEKRREDRFSSIDELAVALAPFAPARSRLSLERISAGAGRLQTGQPRVETVVAEFPVEQPSHAASAPRESSAGTQAGWGHTAAQKKPRSKQWIIWAAAVAVTGTGATLLLRGTATTASTAESPVPSHAATVVAAPPSVQSPSAPPREEAHEPREAASAMPEVVPAPALAPAPAPAPPAVVRPAEAAPPRVPAGQKRAVVPPKAAPAAPKAAPAPNPVKKQSEGWEHDR